MTINSKTTLMELAAIVSTALTESGLEAVLSGGSVVSIYSDNEYQSHDLDFVTAEKMNDLDVVMSSLGFEKQSGRHFAHPSSEWFVEFPSAPLAVGNEPIRKWNQLKTKAGVIQILTPTQSVMDRLAGYYSWNDKQNLEQAVMVASRHPVDISKIKSWSKAENESEKFEQFVQAVKHKKSSLE